MYIYHESALSVYSLRGCLRDFQLNEPLTKGGLLLLATEDSHGMVASVSRLLSLQKHYSQCDIYLIVVGAPPKFVAPDILISLGSYSNQLLFKIDKDLVSSMSYTPTSGPRLVTRGGLQLD